jgi:hypothetical protein
MKKIFGNPEIEIMILGTDDIITTSPESVNGPSGEENGGNETPDW